MPLDSTMRRIITKELTLFFSSPVAYLFLASFAAITLFVFFWVKPFSPATSPMCARCSSECLSF